MEKNTAQQRGRPQTPGRPPDTEGDESTEQQHGFLLVAGRPQDKDGFEENTAHQRGRPQAAGRPPDTEGDASREQQHGPLRAARGPPDKDGFHKNTDGDEKDGEECLTGMTRFPDEATRFEWADASEDERLVTPRARLATPAPDTPEKEALGERQRRRRQQRLSKSQGGMFFLERLVNLVYGTGRPRAR